VIDVPGPIASVVVVPAPASAGGPAAAPPPPPVDYTLTIKQAQARLDQERASLAAARTAMELAAQKLQTLEADLTAAAEAQLVDLALAIAEKVLMQEVDQGRARVEPLVHEVLRHLPARRDLVIRLNPQDLAAVQAAATDVAAPVLGGLKTVADPSLHRGECLVESAEGTVPATLADRLQAAAGALKGGAS
jgi:flagellar biosynthesis/type III secretory pathway protein FliH